MVLNGTNQTISLFPSSLLKTASESSPVLKDRGKGRKQTKIQSNLPPQSYKKLDAILMKHHPLASLNLKTLWFSLMTHDPEHDSICSLECK